MRKMLWTAGLGMICAFWAIPSHSAPAPVRDDVNYATHPDPFDLEPPPWRLWCQFPGQDSTAVAAPETEPVSQLGEGGVWELSGGRLYVQIPGQVCGAVEQ